MKLFILLFTGASRSVEKNPQRSKMENFATIVNGCNPITIVSKFHILNDCSPGYVNGKQYLLMLGFSVWG